MIDNLLLTLGLLERQPRNKDINKAIDSLKTAINHARHIKSLLTDNSI